MHTKLLISLAIAALALDASAQSSNTKVNLEPVIRQAIPDCDTPSKLTQEDLRLPLPAGFVGKAFNVENNSPGCGGRHTVVMAPSGAIFVGNPWPLVEMKGTPAEKLRQFGMNAFNEQLTANVGKKTNEDGLFPADVTYSTEGGKVSMQGWVDPAGTTYFPGIFYSASGDIARMRLERLAPVLTGVPVQGPEKARVTLIEFSDFQCPSCKSAASFTKPILEKYGDRVRYTRLDFPLMSAHPWAYGAAIMGRAIHQQSPEAFWKFKDAIYENQAELNLFTLEDFARGFVTDHELNVEKYDAAVGSLEIRKHILDTITIGNAVQVQGTPTFLVNGTIVMPGTDGKHLASALEKALAR